MPPVLLLLLLLLPPMPPPVAMPLPSPLPLLLPTVRARHALGGPWPVVALGGPRPVLGGPLQLVLGGLSWRASTSPARAGEPCPAPT